MSERFRRREVEPRDVLGHVDQGVVGNGVEEHVGIAQAKIEIDQGDGVLLVLGQDAAQIDGQAGGAHAADGAGHGDDLAAAGPVFAGTEAAFADPSQRRQQVFDADRLGEELLGPGPHRPQDQLPVVRRADHQHGAVGRVLVQPADQVQGLVRDRRPGRPGRCPGLVWATTSAKNS